MNSVTRKDAETAWAKPKVKNEDKSTEDCPFVGKGGLKLQFALEHFDMDVGGLTVADLGCHIGGFTDCLLMNGAEKIYAVDTAYGIFAWKLRNDKRVVLFERMNALYWIPPELVDMVVIDLGWTRQVKSLPAAAEILKPGGEILSLVKPQYEAPGQWLKKGVVPEERLKDTMSIVHDCLPKNLKLIQQVCSPYLGGGGNTEFWFRLTLK